MSWLSPARWLLAGGLIAALVLGYFAWAVHQQGIGYARAQAEYAKQAQKVDTARLAIAAPIAEKQEAAQVQIRIVTKTITKEVPVYVKSSDCPMPGGFRLLHDAAAHGVLPDPAGLADAAAVPAAIAAETIITNYGLYFETAERLRGLQEWVSAQRTLK